MFENILTLVERRLVLFLTAIFILRVGHLFFSGLDLIGDESYYWDWSRKLDWCYFSKPPMVAWIIAASTVIGGDNVVAVRMPAVIMGTVSLYYLYATAKAFYTPKAGALAVLLILAMPFNVLANFLMTIDAPLNCFWVMSLYYLRRALFDNHKNAWVLAGTGTGAALLTKQVAVLVPLAVMVFLIIHPMRRNLFKHEFLLYAAPIILSIIPVLWWNHQHEWVMFAHSKGHFGIKESVALTDRLQDAAEFSGYQLLLATPVLFGVILVLTLKKFVNFSRISPEEQFLMLMGPILLIGIIALSLVQKVQGNWPMPFYLSGLILLSGQSFGSACKKSLKVGMVLGYLMVLLTYLMPVAVKTLHLENTQFDPASRFRHWNELADSVEAIRQKILPDNEGAILVTVGHRFLTSQLAFYLPDHPNVYRYEGSGRVASQYELWDGPEHHIGKSALIVTDNNQSAIPGRLISVFETFRLVGTFSDPMDIKNRYYLYFGEGLRRWPKLPYVTEEVQ